MGFDDLFKHGRNGHRNDHGYYGGHGNGHHDNHWGIERSLYLFEKLKNSKKLLIALSVLAIVIAIIVIAVVIIIMPIIMKLFEAIQKNGIVGIIDTVKPLLERLWSGTGK